jgi:chemotaxis family two-component system response regulator Rcp1
MHNPPNHLAPILLIDDAPADIFILQRLLAKADVHNPTIVLNDAEEVVPYLEAALQSPESGAIPCLIFTDLRMPGMDGLKFAGWMCGQRRLSRVPLVVLSASDAPIDIQRARVIGVETYIVKFPPLEEFRKIITGLLER